MVAFTFSDMLSGAPAGSLSGITDLDIRWRDGTEVLYSAGGSSGGISAFTLSGGGVQFLDWAAFTGTALQAAPTRLEDAMVGGQPVVVVLGGQETAPQYFDLGAGGELLGSGQFTAQGGFSSALVSLEYVTTGNGEMAYASLRGTGGLTVYQVDAGGQLAESAYIGPATGVQGADIVAIEAVTIGGTDYLVTASAFGNEVKSYRIDANGIPVETGSLGAADGLGIFAPTVLVPVGLGGVQYFVLAAAGSNSLSVLRLDAGGTLTAVDHVTDDLSTRFGDVTALEAITVNGRVLLVAGGGDDGLSLFELLPGGRLLHLAQIADDTEMALSNVTALALTEQSGVIEVFASGESEAGITRLRIDISALVATVAGGAGADTLTGTAGDNLIDGGAGDDQLTGGAGDDILIDGAGQDMLTGGDGADTFLFQPDGQIDTVTDFQIGIDRLDLSALGWLRNFGQLDIQTTSLGADITFGAETVRILSADGNPLAAADFSLSDFLNLEHHPINPATDPIPDPDPDPDPDPPAGIDGGSGDDVLTGTGADDLVRGFGGGDTLSGGAGADTMEGGSGDDVVRGEDGNDRLDGGAGRDLLYGGPGADFLAGGLAADTLNGDGGDDTLQGGAGADNLVGGAGTDTADYSDAPGGKSGGVRVDLQYSSLNAKYAAGDTLDGIENVLGSDGQDYIAGDAGANLIFGGAYVDFLVGRAGDDTIEGGIGNDVLYGGTGADVLRGGSGSDRAHYGNALSGLVLDLANPAANTGQGVGDSYDSIEEISGGLYDDTIYGDGGANRLFGFKGVGADQLFGRGGDDYLNGGAGADTLNGGAGSDTMRGGAGTDTFVFNAGADVVEDFNTAQADRIALDVSALGLAGLNAAQVISTYASTTTGEVVFDFGAGNTLTLENITTTTGLDAQIDLI